tara:strand:+ start:439 stop:723 length:285 start_codon:yes stop_codon:yes gene_type:complete
MGTRRLVKRVLKQLFFLASRQFKRGKGMEYKSTSMRIPAKQYALLKSISETQQMSINSVLMSFIDHSLELYLKAPSGDQSALKVRSILRGTSND